MFRNQIPDEHTQQFISLFSNFLNSMSIVNQSYAAACIEKLLVKKSKTTNQPVVTGDNLDPNV